MRSTFDFCLPTKSSSVPDGPDWLREIKYDGYRLCALLIPLSRSKDDS
jgi:bifunctional non-homologous end joining protein LigD